MRDKENVRDVQSLLQQAGIWNLNLPRILIST
jgi:hypothetical protein